MLRTPGVPGPYFENHCPRHVTSFAKPQVPVSKEKMAGWALEVVQVRQLMD
jgi:hypothetical protein